jgi:hypothetical protein
MFFVLRTLAYQLQSQADFLLMLIGEETRPVLRSHASTSSQAETTQEIAHALSSEELPTIAQPATWPDVEAGDAPPTHWLSLVQQASPAWISTGKEHPQNNSLLHRTVLRQSTTLTSQSLTPLSAKKPAIPAPQDVHSGQRLPIPLAVCQSQTEPILAPPEETQISDTDTLPYETAEGNLDALVLAQSYEADDEETGQTRQTADDAAMLAASAPARSYQAPGRDSRPSAHARSATVYPRVGVTPVGQTRHSRTETLSHALPAYEQATTDLPARAMHTPAMPAPFSSDSMSMRQTQNEGNTASVRSNTPTTARPLSTPVPITYHYLSPGTLSVDTACSAGAASAPGDSRQPDSSYGYKGAYAAGSSASARSASEPEELPFHPPSVDAHRNDTPCSWPSHDSSASDEHGASISARTADFTPIQLAVPWPVLPDEQIDRSQTWHATLQLWKHRQRLDDEQRGNVWNA